MLLSVDDYVFRVCGVVACQRINEVLPIGGRVRFDDTNCLYAFVCDSACIYACSFNIAGPPACVAKVSTAQPRR